MTHRWIEEMEFKEMIYEQIEDEEQMTDQWIKDQMEKTDECIELEQEITRMFEKKQKMTIRSTFQTVIQNILDESIANFVLTAFAVCSSRLNGRKGFQQQVTFGKVFCH